MGISKSVDGGHKNRVYITSVHQIKQRIISNNLSYLRFKPVRDKPT